MHKISNKIFINFIHQHIKSFTDHDKMRFIPLMQGWFNTCKTINVVHHINGMKDKSYKLISIDTEISFDKTQHLFMIQPPQKLGIEGICLNVIKAVDDKPRAHIIVNDETLKPFSLMSRQRLPFSLSLFNIELEFLARAIRQEKEIKSPELERKKNNCLCT